MAPDPAFTRNQADSGPRRESRSTDQDAQNVLKAINAINGQGRHTSQSSGFDVTDVPRRHTMHEQQAEEPTQEPEAAPEPERGLLGRVQPKWLALAAALLVAAAGLVGYVVTLPTTYTATSIIALRSQTPDPSGQALELIASEYAVFLASPANTADVERPFATQMATGSVLATVDPLTATIRIKVTSGSTDSSIKVADGIADVGIKRGTTDTQVRAALISNASASPIVKAPKKSLYLVAGLGLLVCVGGIAAYYLRRLGPRQ